MKRTGLIPILAFTSWSLSGPAIADVPIMLEGGTGLDPCGSGQIYRLDPAGDGFLSVRTGPGTDFQAVDRLYNGNHVYVCDRRGQWVGVVYGGYQKCGVTIALAFSVPYSGPCRFGWVYETYVAFVAG